MNWGIDFAISLSPPDSRVHVHLQMRQATIVYGSPQKALEDPKSHLNPYRLGDLAADSSSKMKPINMLLCVVLLISAAVGSYILATDSYLKSTAPTHADGLAAFTVIDLVLIVGVWRRPRIAIIVAVLLGLVQMAAMGGDVFFGTLTFSSNVTTAAAFSSYLLGDMAFLTLLGVQVVLILVGIAAFVLGRRAPAVQQVARAAS